ncbi:MAG TPA: methyltransferase domain-containing protein [Stellaceae bacterium]|nr:methyltransferase domain-containing protein [Stellaceae bacterium]
MTDRFADLPLWALEILRCPQTDQALTLRDNRLVRQDGSDVGLVESGIVRMPMTKEDDNIRIYKRLGGAHFWERAKIPYAMSALDTPIYHEYLREVRPPSVEAVIVDVGGGDGRNTRPWLEQGFQRVVVVDAVAEALARLRSRIKAEAPDWLERVLLLEADARSLPLATGCASTVLAIESLYYLNDDYERGLRECVRVLKRGGKMLLSERDYEGGLFLRLLYHGIAPMLDSSHSHSIVDGEGDATMRTRCFTEAELVAMLSRNGLRVNSVRGTSLLAMVLGWMRHKELIATSDVAHLDETTALLRDLGREGRNRRCHVAVAERIG